MVTPKPIPLRISSARARGLSAIPLRLAEGTRTYNMEALTTALTLESGSVAAHPAYRILYKDNLPALRSFITHVKSLTYEEAGADVDFCKAILEDEKGDDVSYSVITANLSKLRMTASSSPLMPAILTAIDKLLEIRDHWLQAGVRYFSFDCWYSMVRGYFIKNNDPELLSLLKDAPEEALENFLHFRSEFSDPMRQIGYQADLNELRTAYVQRHRDLMTYKRQMQKELGSFRSIHAQIDTHLKKLAEFREAEKQKQNEKLVRRVQLKQRTLQTSIQQMGQLGSAPLDEDVQDAMDDMHEALYEEHFEVKNNDEDPEEQMKFEEWQKEILSRSYNVDNECKQNLDSRKKPSQKRTYVISFGQEADQSQCLGGPCRVLEGAPTTHIRRHTIRALSKPTITNAATTELPDDRTAESAKQLDLETWTSAPASILDKDTLAWMALNYGQRKPGGLRDVWKALFDHHDTPKSIGNEGPKRKSRRRLRKRSRSRSRTAGNGVREKDGGGR